MTVTRPFLLALAISLAFSPAAQANDLPSLGDASSAIVAPEQEYQLGRAWLSMLRRQVTQLSDPLLKDFVERHVYRLAETSQLQDRRLEFVILDSPQLNAFAVPGGIIGVNGGLFLNAQTEAEFASVLAHELAHLSQRHYARGLEAQQRMQLPLMAAMLAGVVAAAAGAGDAAMAAIASSQAAAIQSQRSFSRQNEQEADRIGLTNLRNAGYDPRGMPSMFERLARQYRFDAKPPEFLLTHPLSESRVADSRNRAEQTPPGGKVDSLAYQLMRARTQLQFESTPGLATKRFRALLEENPQNDAARYGLAISLQRAGHREEAGRALQPLLDKSPDDIAYNLARVELDIDEQRFAKADKRLERLLQLHPGNYPTRQMKVELLLAQSRPGEAEAILDNLVRERPKDPDIWYQIAEVRGLSGNIIGVHQARAEFFALVGDYGQALNQLDYAKRRVMGNYPLTARIEARQEELRNEQRILEEMLK